MPKKIELKDITIGIPQEYLGEGLEKSIRERLELAVEKLSQKGAKIKRISLGMTEYAIAAYYLICTAEASSNLSRFDGVKFGFRAKNKNDLRMMYETTRHNGFGDEVKRRIILGTYVLSAGYYDAYYKKAQKVRTLIRQDYSRAFQTCDVILGPTTPTTAFRLGEKTDDPLSMYLSDLYTVSGPLAGLPSISVPYGEDSNGLPVGIQLTGQSFTEQNLLTIADHIEKLTYLAA